MVPAGTGADGPNSPGAASGSVAPGPRSWPDRAMACQEVSSAAAPARAWRGAA